MLPWALDMTNVLSVQSDYLASWDSHSKPLRNHSGRGMQGILKRSGQQYGSVNPDALQEHQEFGKKKIFCGLKTITSFLRPQLLHKYSSLPISLAYGASLLRKLYACRSVSMEIRRLKKIQANKAWILWTISAPMHRRPTTRPGTVVFFPPPPRVNSA